MLAAVQAWVTRGWGDFGRDARLLATLSHLLGVAEARSDLVSATAALQQVLRDRLAEDSARRRRLQAWSTEAPCVAVVVIDAEHLAQQLTLYNWRVRGQPMDKGRERGFGA